MGSPSALRALGVGAHGSPGDVFVSSAPLRVPSPRPRALACDVLAWLGSKTPQACHPAAVALGTRWGRGRWWVRAARRAATSHRAAPKAASPLPRRGRGAWGSPLSCTRTSRGQGGLQASRHPYRSQARRSERDSRSGCCSREGSGGLAAVLTAASPPLRETAAISVLPPFPSFPVLQGVK